MAKPKFKKVLDLPYRVEYAPKGNRFFEDSFMALLKDNNPKNDWVVYKRKYSSKKINGFIKGGYYKPLYATSNKDNAINYIKKRIK
jgi:hypothetical protein